MGVLGLAPKHRLPWEKGGCVRGKEGQKNPVVDTCRSLKRNCRRSDLLGYISL